MMGTTAFYKAEASNIIEHGSHWDTAKCLASALERIEELEAELKKESNRGTDN